MIPLPLVPRQTQPMEQVGEVQIYATLVDQKTQEIYNLSMWFLRLLPLGLLPAIALSQELSFPSSVRLQFTRDGVKDYYCTGVKLDDRTILSAAHCFGDFTQGAWSCSSLETTFLLRDQQMREYRLTAEAIVLHPQIKLRRTGLYIKAPFKGAVDLAIVRFRENLPVTLVRAVFARNPPFQNEQLLLGGFGQTEANGKNPNGSLRMKTGWVSGFLGDSFTLKSQDPEPFVKGDSGGPVYRRGSYSFEVVGINSMREADQMQRVYTYGERSYSIPISYIGYATKLDTSLGWITNQVNSRPPTDCRLGIKPPPVKCTSVWPFCP